MTNDERKKLGEACDDFIEAGTPGWCEAKPTDAWSLTLRLARAFKAELSRPEAPLPEEVVQDAFDGGRTFKEATEYLNRLIKSSPPRLTVSDVASLWAKSSTPSDFRDKIIDRLSQDEATPIPPMKFIEDVMPKGKAPPAVTVAEIRQAMCNADAFVKCEYPACHCHGEFEATMARYTKAIAALFRERGVNVGGK